MSKDEQIADLTSQLETVRAESDANQTLARQLQAELGAIKKVANPKRVLALELFVGLVHVKPPHSDNAVDTLAIHAYSMADRVLAQWDKKDANTRQASNKPTKSAPHQ